MIFSKRARHCGTVYVFSHLGHLFYLQKFERSLNAKVVVLVVAFVLAQSFAFAQGDFRNGYVVTTAGDTLSGQVEYRAGANAYKSCTFKSANNQATTYQPGEINAYGFKGDRVFESHKIKVDGESLTTVFLEVLVRGRVTLYELDGKYWANKEGQEFHPLVEEQKKTVVNGNDVYHTAKFYVGILNILLSDCQAVSSQIQKTKLNKKSLTDLLDTYNKCNGGTSVVYQSNKPWTKAIVAVVGGLNVSQIKFKDEPGLAYMEGDFEVSKSAVIGATIDIVSPRINERLSLHTGLLFTESKYYSYYELDYSSTFRRNYVTFEFQEMKIPAGLRYSFLGHKVEPYVNAGVSLTLHLKSNSTWVEEIERDNVLVETIEQEALPLKKNQIGFWGGVGASTAISKKFAIFTELRFEKTNGVSVVIPGSIESSVSNVQVFIGVRTR